MDRPPGRGVFVRLLPELHGQLTRPCGWAGGWRSADCRAVVHRATEGRVGYLHVPDMMALGWAQLHRDLHTEVSHEAVVLDVRSNGGGHTSQLVVEKLAREFTGWIVPRGKLPHTYPRDV